MFTTYSRIYDVCMDDRYVWNPYWDWKCLRSTIELTPIEAFEVLCT